MRPLRNALLLCVAFVAASVLTATGAEPARVALVQQSLPDGNIRLLATVTDATGRGVEGAEVIFQARTAFGWLRLGAEETDGTGRASVDLDASSPYAEVSVQVGEGTTVRAALLRQSMERLEPGTRPGFDVLQGLSPQPGFISPYPPVQILFVAVVLGGIWTTYAYLVSLLLRIRRAQ